MGAETGDVTTSMEDILGTVTREGIGPDGFGPAAATALWRGLDARDCRNQVERCRAWIRLQDRTKTIRPGVTSADYMHSVERFYNHHILKGAFLAAAFLEGVAVKRCGPDARFNLRINRHRNVL
ncbi:hypothetical protein OPKNFCMD_1032 [Methylobacterium crusticola]|uniref:Uncharacterized protein n=1 Tax=Methylobacterium crusticola TaxID=1697972 RepID=A0ABQ4QSV2_9HYPH|nr:hypothetical protein [Methylobacterium crusticola]GJD48314.1 hypothetical protein OPKNFCMD_1032 [Methylobacterium crusticola]